jgi:hypothetical protein
MLWSRGEVDAVGFDDERRQNHLGDVVELKQRLWRQQLKR